jgi:hypothetical protein
VPGAGKKAEGDRVVWVMLREVVAVTAEEQRVGGVEAKRWRRGPFHDVMHIHSTSADARVQYGLRFTQAVRPVVDGSPEPGLVLTFRQALRRDPRH